jgi:hypothetical protein
MVIVNSCLTFLMRKEVLKDYAPTMIVVSREVINLRDKELQ